MEKEEIYQMKDVAGRAARIRDYMVRLAEREPDVLQYGDEWKKFVETLAVNLSKLSIVDFGASYNPYDKTLDSVWKVIGGYTLSIAQFFTEDEDNPYDDKVIFSIHSPEKELLVSDESFIQVICDILLELEPQQMELGQPERICNRFKNRSENKFDEYNDCTWRRRKREEENKIEEDNFRKREPVKIGEVIRKVIDKLKSCYVRRYK